MAKVPTYILKEPYRFGPLHDMKEMPQGSFIRPIELCYVPKHCFSGPAATYYSKERDVFCYTHYGIIPIPKNLVVEVTW